MSQDWWSSAVIYQIYPLSFFDSNDDGIGDLPGVSIKLDYVASLGVDAIWLSPFFVSPLRDAGYDVADYRDVDPIFGTLADFDGLLARAHGLGLKVLIDMVWAHTSDRHPWFLESSRSPSNPRSDWYVWADASADGTPPNNWLSVFGGPAWTWGASRRQYFLHHFLPSQPKLNVQNPAVLAALFEVARFWLERGVDGIRLDAVDFLAHDEALRDNPPAADGRHPVKPYHMQQHVHDQGGARNQPIINAIRSFIDHYPGTMMVCEVGSETSDRSSLARAGAYLGEAGTGAHATYSLSQMKSSGDAAAIRDGIREVENLLPSEGFFWAFSNHDVTRVVSRWGDESEAAAKLYLALLLSLRGGMFIYQGEELGLPEGEVPLDRLRDPYGRGLWPVFKGRDGCRTPMPWRGTAPNAGFSGTTSTWLPASARHAPLAVDLQAESPNSTLNFCRRFLAWRKSRPAMLHGRLVLQDAAGTVVAFERVSDAEHLLCVFNLERAPAWFRSPYDRLRPAFAFGASKGEQTIELSPYGAFFAFLDRDTRSPRHTHAHVPDA